MAALPLSYASFVQGFARVTADGTAHDELAWKRQKVVAKAAGIAPAREDSDGKARKPSNVDRVPMIRYAMGADDNLYLQSGIGMLFRSQGVDPAKELPLSPAALYTSSAINALRKSLLNQQIDRARSLADTASDNKADYVRTLNEVFYDQYKYMPSRIDANATDDVIAKRLTLLQKRLAPGNPLEQSQTEKANQKLAAEREQLSELHEKAKAESERLAQEVAKLKDEKDQLNQHLGHEEAQLAAAKLEVVKATALLQTANIQKDEIYKNAKAAELKKSEENTKLEELLKIEASKRAKVESDLKEAKLKVEATQLELTANTTSVQALTESLIEAEQSQYRTTSRATIDGIREQLKAANTEQSNLNYELTEALKKLEATHTKTQTELEEAGKKSADQIDQLSLAETEFQLAKRESITKEAQVTALESRYEAAKRVLSNETAETREAFEKVEAAAAELGRVEGAQQAAAAEAASLNPKTTDLQKWQQSLQQPPERRFRKLKNALRPFLTIQATPTTPLVGYALARGLCGHRGPHEAPSDAPTDALLTYAVPSGIVHALARTKHLHVPDSFAPPPPPPDAPDPFVQGEVDAALAGDFAIDAAQPDTSAVRPARAVRWQPRGPHAEALATAAALEHAAARCTQLADAGDLSERAQARLRDMATTFKLHQLDSLYEISCAIESGEELPLQPETPMVTRPVAQLRGTLHYAHDAGHHPAPPTAVVDEGARWTASDQRAQSTFRSTTEGNVYLAPSTERLGYQPMPTGAPSTTPAKPPLKSLGSEGFSGSIMDAMNNLVLWGLYYYNRPSANDIKHMERVQEQLAIGESDEASPVERRGGVWNEFLRDMSITSDRVWVFVRTVSGLIGEDASSLVSTADDASITAAREQKQREREISDRVATFQAKIVDSLVAGMVRESKLQLDVHQTPDAGEADAGKAASKLVVINANTAKQIHDLASGESGRPFFEANVALRNLTDRSTQNKQPLGDIVQAITEVASKLKKAMEADAAQVSPPGTTLAELSLPRNSYFVKLREDTAAAIRSAFDKLTHELSHSGVRQLRLYELVEGCDHLLSSRFAEFVGHVLIQNRSSTGVSALYASRSQLTVNASQAYVSLRRLVSHAAHYASHVPMPNFDADDAPTLQAQRDAYFLRQKDVTCIAHQRDVARPSQLRIVNRLPGSFGAPGGGGVSRYGMYG